MKFSWKKISETSCEYNVFIDHEELKEQKNAARKLILEGIKLPGFRKGAKIPPQLLKRYETKENYAYNGARALTQKAYQFALEKATKEKAPAPNKIPELHIDLDDNLNATIKLTFTPEVLVNSPTLSSIEVKLDDKKYEITEEKIDNHIATMKDKLASLVLKEKGKLEKDNIAIIDFEGSVDGEVFEGGSAKNHELVIGSGQFIPGFEDQIIGMKVDEEKTITVTFPENYQISHLQNVAVDFKVKLNEIRVKEELKNDKEFIETLNVDKVKTVKDVRNYAKELLEKGLERQKEEDYWSMTLNKAINSSDFYFPESIVQEQFKSLKKTFENNLEEKKLTLDIYAELFNTTVDQINETIRRDAINNLKKDFIVPTMGRSMGITIEDKDIEKLARDVLVNQIKDYTKEQLSRFISANRNNLFRVLMERRVREDTVDKMKRSQKLKEDDKTVKEDKVKAKGKTTKKTQAKKETPKKETTKKPKSKKETAKKPAAKKKVTKKETTKKPSKSKEIKKDK